MNYFRKRKQAKQARELLRHARHVRSMREDVMCETHGYGDDITGRAVITGRHKYIANQEQMHELYDLRNDPFELNNLIDHPDNRDLLEDMKRRLALWQERTIYRDR